ncbi:purine-binding chemotaxis protein CheW [Candidatus Gracilibacteria bacterium]|nr:purine-binding chemotaxis protein CheW [Candidatus Gracilibacteria bacterium]
MIAERRSYYGLSNAGPTLERCRAERKLLLVALSNEWYAIPGEHLREVSRWHAPTPVPGAPPALPGLISRHGVILTVVATHLLFGSPMSTPGRRTRYVIVTVDDVHIALLVDAVDDLVDIPFTAFAPPPEGITTHKARLIRAITQHQERALAVVDLPALVAALRAS